MGGGELDLQFQAGDLHAWLTVRADFLFTWKPFYFIGEVGVSIGASYKLDLLFTSVTVSVELGADLQIWGPPTGGKVHVDWYIISFSIGFGADLASDWPPASFQTWDQFKDLIPARNSSDGRLKTLKGDAAPDPELITIALSAGLAGTDGDTWLVRGDGAAFTISTPIPITDATFDAADTPAYAAPAGQSFGVRAMGIATASSTLNVSLTNSAGAVSIADGWTWSQTIAAVPASLWGAPVTANGAPTTPSTPTADTLPGWLVALSSLSPPTPALTGPPPIPLATLSFARLDSPSDWLPLDPAEAAVARQPAASPSSIGEIATIATPPVADARSALFAALAACGYDAGADGSMAEVGANVGLSYADAPMLGAPWRAAA